MEKNYKGLNIAIISLASAAVIALLIFFIMNISMASYKNVAEKYDKAINEGRYEDAYEYLDVEDSVFLTEKEFLERNSVLSDVLNGFDIKSIIKTVGKKGINIALSRLLGVQYKVIEASDEDGIASVTYEKSSKYDVYGILKDMSTVQLKKSDHNHMLFFPNWRISDENIIVNDITLYVPKCQKVLINGIEMPASYMQGEEGNYVIYKIPGLYNGDQVCSITMDGENYKHYNISAKKSKDTIYVEDINATPEQQLEAVNAAYDAFKKIIDAEAKGADFSEIQGMFTPDSLKAEKEKFNEDKASFITTNKTSGIKEVNVKDVTATFYDVSFTNGTVEIGVMLEYNDSNKGVVEPFIASFTGKSEGEDYNNNDTQIIRMQYVDGKWLVSSSGENRIAENNWFVL